MSMIKGYVEEKHDAELDNKNNKNIEDKSKINIDIWKSKLSTGSFYYILFKNLLTKPFIPIFLFFLN